MSTSRQGMARQEWENGGDQDQRKDAAGHEEDRSALHFSTICRL
jgi:hypothetical protein